MATVTAPPAACRFRNVAELQQHLGGVPAERIRLQPAPGQATEEDVIRIHDHEGSICELIDGVLVEKAMATFEALVAGLLLTFINNHLADHDLGIALPPDGLLRLFPGRVRAPDVSFISWKRMPNSELPDEAIASLTPDLAVEVLSTTNTPAEIRMKIEEYFQAGSKLVWIVDPNARTVRVYTSPRRSVLLTEEDTLDGRKVLPGFSLPIREWFARASRRARR
jgi:Uma2 family endonuclease